ncbi:MAG TPA: glycosyltransferase family 39 protein, partial [Tepidisphaeraceae bacterium]|nr:glycosyltransferase family 39 protein [Tepidisphaeraceae bacterium]
MSAVSTAHLREIRITNSPATHQKAWLVALSFIFAVTVLRLIYLIWFCPYQLVGDEAYYWEQARHLDLCYNEKGPALPWLIYFCCHIFGDTEWAVRLPVVVSFALAAWGVGRLAIHITNGNRKAGLIAVICFCLLHAFQANAQICTQDGPLIAIWIALTAIGLRLLHRWRDGRNTCGEWLLLWFTIGIGFLFKQS